LAVSVKTLALSIGTALVQLLPLTVGFMALGKVMEAFSNRNKDAKARTEELTAAIKEQTDAIQQQENALKQLSIQGLDLLNEALVKTGKEGEETTNALISVGKSAGDYVDTMRDFKKNTESASFALAKQKGFTEEQAKAIAKFVKDVDKGTDSQHRGMMVAQGFTVEMIETAMALEQLDDASENTDFAKLTKGIIESTIRSNEATQQFYDEAKALATAAEASGKKMSEDEPAIFIYEQFIELSAQYEDQQNRIASINEKLAQSQDRVTDRMMALIGAMKDGEVASEDFLRALMGAANYAKVTASKAYFDMGTALYAFGESMKQTKGNQNALVSAGYEFMSMLSQNQATILGMGGTLADVDAAMVQMIDAFYKQGVAAGWSKEELQKVLVTMGLLKENGDVILTVDVRIEGLEQLRQTALAMGNLDMFNEITKQLQQMKAQGKRTFEEVIKSFF
jgi:hypothetical protein